MDNTRRELYTGKAKVIFEGPDPESVVQHFKDDLTAFNAQKKDVLPGKGAINNRISYLLMRHLENHGISTHLIELLNDREQLVRKVHIIPIEVVVRNLASGSLCKKFCVEHGTIISPPIVEFYYKNDPMEDPMMAEDHIISFGLATREEITGIRATSLKINEVLGALLSKVGITLVDFKVEFGRLEHPAAQILLADEISPDTCRFWDSKDHTVLDKDIYRLGSGNVLQGYAEVLRRIESYLT
ncbi:MAG: phosphoribosylaminoimidazolesuccinocarboxamide synthase [Anaplasma sp.]